MNFRLLSGLLKDAVIIAEELRKFKAVLLYLEKYRYGHCEKLRTQCQVFWQSRSSPSVLLKRVAVLNTLVGLRMNPVNRVALNIGLPYDFLVIKLMDGFKKKLVLVLTDWLTALAELEALSSLANYAYLNPHTTFPKLLDYSPGLSGKVFCVEDMGHPLLPDDLKKRNDFHFARSGEVALITGSNMSGKSTFIKTIGVNLCLAYAGGPVDATSFETPIFRLFTCIKINDSIADGFSLFYAEVKRLKSLLNALRCPNERPLLFLIDEIFKGTNNRERLIGGRSYVRALAGQNGLGFIATHDLELTNLAHSIQQLANYHFREDVQNGRMVFDYRIRSGPCPTTNALKIMEMEGLPIDRQAMTS